MIACEGRVCGIGYADIAHVWFYVEDPNFQLGHDFPNHGKREKVICGLIIGSFCSLFHLMHTHSALQRSQKNIWQGEKLEYNITKTNPCWPTPKLWIGEVLDS